MLLRLSICNLIKYLLFFLKFFQSIDQGSIFDHFDLYIFLLYFLCIIVAGFQRCDPSVGI